MNTKPIRIGIVGSGYVSHHFYLMFQNRLNITITKVLTRRDLDHCKEYPNPEVLTNSLNELIDHCDLVYECSGDPIYAADVINQAFLANKPVVTTNTEFHVTAGSYFIDKGLLSEAEGDQPGALAALHERALGMGFKPLAYINMKGFLNTNPKPENMKYWAAKNGISIPSVTSFTDGTKIQLEQALVANGCGATFQKKGMIGLNESDVTKIASFYGNSAKKVGQAISDYIIYPGAPHSVFVIAEHHESHQPMLRYVKMGEGPYYVLRQDSILIHLEVPRTIHRLLETKKPLLDNSRHPTINVAAISKTDLKKDTVIKNGIGSFEVRGEGLKISDYPNALPIGLMQNARLIRDLEPNQIVTFDDVELPESLAFNAWQWVRQKHLTKETVS